MDKGLIYPRDTTFFPIDYRVFIKYCVFSQVFSKVCHLSLVSTRLFLVVRKNYQPLGHSHCVERFECPLQRCLRGRGCSELWKNTFFLNTLYLQRNINTLDMMNGQKDGKINWGATHGILNFWCRDAGSLCLLGLLPSGRPSRWSIIQVKKEKININRQTELQTCK